MGGHGGNLTVPGTGGQGGTAGAPQGGSAGAAPVDTGTLVMKCVHLNAGWQHGEPYFQIVSPAGRMDAKWPCDSKVVLPSIPNYTVFGYGGDGYYVGVISPVVLVKNEVQTVSMMMP